MFASFSRIFLHPAKIRTFWFAQAIRGTDTHLTDSTLSTAPIIPKIFSSFYPIFFNRITWTNSRSIIRFTYFVFYFLPLNLITWIQSAQNLCSTIFSSCFVRYKKYFTADVEYSTWTIGTFETNWSEFGSLLEYYHVEPKRAETNRKVDFAMLRLSFENSLLHLMLAEIERK